MRMNVFGIYGMLTCLRRAEGPLPTVDHVGLIYSRRAKHVRKYKYPIYGIDRMVENLEKTDRSYVRVHSIEAEQFTYHIFTDEHRDVLFGIVAIDDSTDWRKHGNRFRQKYFPNQRA